MYVCDKGHCLVVDQTRVITRQETIPVRDVPITITTQVRVCNQCGADVSDRDLDARSLDQAYAWTSPATAVGRSIDQVWHTIVL